MRYVTVNNGALSVLVQRMKHGVRRMLKLPAGLLDTVELSTQYYTTRKMSLKHSPASLYIYMYMHTLHNSDRMHN